MTLRLTVTVPAGPLHRSAGATVSVALTNDGDAPVLVNRRMAAGYLDSISREIYCDIDADYGIRKYDRDLPVPSDYGPIEPGESVVGEFDLLTWYRISAPGTYRLVVHYQCDEAPAHPPAGIARGVLSAAAQQITVD